MEMYLYSIDNMLSSQVENNREIFKTVDRDDEDNMRALGKLEDEIYTHAINSYESDVRYSCHRAFIQEEFYTKLPPRLQSKLI